MSYQKITGPLMANSHPGSYCGQDAYNDMFVTEKKKNDLHNGKTGLPHKGSVNGGICADGIGLQRSTDYNKNSEWGGCEMNNENDAEKGGDEMKDVSTIVRRLTPL